MKSKELAQMRSDLINAIVQYDLMRAGRSGYSIYALPHYLGIAEKVVDSVVDGESMRRAINDYFEGELLSFILSNVKEGEMQNPAKSRKENYTNFDDWEVDAFRAGATQVIRLGEDLFSAIKMKDGSLVKLDKEGYVDMRSRAGQKVRKESVTVGAWYGDRGEIYRHLIKNNPVRPRKGESSRDFVSRCMSEEKASFPEPKQRIAVCLSKSRKRNPLESGATISDDEDINFRASNMG